MSLRHYIKIAALVSHCAVFGASIGIISGTYIGYMHGKDRVLQQQAAMLKIQHSSKNTKPLMYQRAIYQPQTKIQNISDEDVTCLAQNIYHESRNQGPRGMAAVAWATLYRVDNKRFPNNVCDVVKQAKMVKSWKSDKFYPARNKCQFSWYCDGKSDTPKDKVRWKSAVDMAKDILFDGKWEGIIPYSTHYHAKYVSPYWSKKMKKVAVIGDHIFYN